MIFHLSRPAWTAALVGLAIGTMAFAVAFLHHRHVEVVAQEAPGDASAADSWRYGQRDMLCTSANARGVGLRGEYFARSGFLGGTLLARTDSTIDFDSSLGWPSDHATEMPKSARWTGWVRAPITGRYKFHVEPHDALVTISRVRVAGNTSSADASLELIAGRFYPISVEVDRIDPLNSSIRLEWTAPHGARFIIPRSLLNPPTDTVSSSPRA
jgi:hypothetical protein